MRSKKHKPRSKFKKFLLICSIVIGVLILAVGGYGFYLYHSVAQTTSKMYHPLKGSSNKDLVLAKSKNTPPSINILLLGVDQRTGDKGRSDTLIVASLNPQTHSMLLTSIPRDTRVQIPGQSGYSKINAAYAYGNEDLAVHTVEKYLNINIPYYAKVNMEGLSGLVDAVGGVTVQNDIDWYDEGYYKKGFHYAKGPLTLNGKEALGYVRMRHLDPRGDFGRNLRQRQVIQAVLEKGKNFTSITKMHSILDTLGSNVTTNLTFNDMKRLATDYRSCKDHVTSYETQGTPKYIDGVSWVLVTNNEFQNVHNKIMKQLTQKS